MSPGSETQLLERYGVTLKEYRAVHHFLRKKATKTGQCTNPRCRREGPTHWSLRPGKRYEKKLQNFRELCPRCAQLVDRGGTLTHCPHGHVRETNTRSWPSGKTGCYLCQVERNRRQSPGSLRRMPRPLPRGPRRAST
jgi:hypothetical protein